MNFGIGHPNRKAYYKTYANDQKNQTGIKNKRKRYNEKNAEKNAKRQKEYDTENIEQKRKQNQKYKSQHKEQIKQKEAEYNKKNQEDRKLKEAERREEKKNATTKEERYSNFKIDIIDGPNFVCFSCNRQCFKKGVKILKTKELSKLFEKVDNTTSTSCSIQ